MRSVALISASILLFLAAACDGGTPSGTMVGPAGGVVEGPDGVVLLIPAGALTEDTRISITKASGSPTGYLPAGPLYAFEPHGLVFNGPVSLTLPYEPGLVQGDVADLQLWMADAMDGPYIPLSGTVDAQTQMVTTTITHFSFGGLGTPDPNCLPQCTDRVCGADGCGGTCAPGCSGASPDCDETTGQCVCIPQCTGRECGPDSCGGTCAPGCDGAACNEQVGLCPECGNGFCDLGENPGNCASDCTPTSALDLLFVIDNSGSMASEQLNLRSNFPALITQLRNTAGGLPDVHIGVTTTDLGTGMFQITYCEELGGEAGNLVTGNCANPTGGAPYLIDVEAQGCDITKDAAGTCSADTCIPANCAHEPTTTFVQDAVTGCPRCRNYAGESLEDAFSCIANLGTMGCGFEQPLESMYKALDPSNTMNTGFVRSDSVLGVVLLTDEDDCSGSNPQLYDNTQTDINSTLGPLTSYRCFEFGVTCDINNRTSTGLRQNCVPREDAAALLYPTTRYTNQLLSLREPGRLVVAAIAGPVTPSSNGVGFDMTIGQDDMNNPELQYSCTIPDGGAVPAIRVFSLVSSMNTPTNMTDWAFSPICNPDYTAPLQGIGQQIGNTFQ